MTDEQNLKQHGWDHGEVPSDLFLNTEISHVAVRSFAYLQWRAARTGQCFPGVTRMAQELGISEATAKNALRELVGNDWIRRQRRLGTSTMTHVFETQALCRQWDNRLAIQSDSGVTEATDNGVAAEQTKDNKLKEEPLAPPKPGAKQVHPLFHEMKALVVRGCKIDIENAPASVHKILGAVVNELLKHYSLDDSEAFFNWWYPHDWRGRNGQAPNYKMLPEFLATLNWRNGASRDAAPADTRAAEEVARIMAARKQEAGE